VQKGAELFNSGRNLLVSLLQQMGNTSQQVAMFLMDGGFIGTTKCHFTCPVALYLRSKGLIRVEVGQLRIGSGVAFVKTPDHIREFIADYDNRRWPALISKDDTEVGRNGKLVAY
jgi:hypothetical protein